MKLKHEIMVWNDFYKVIVMQRSDKVSLSRKKPQFGRNVFLEIIANDLVAYNLYILYVYIHTYVLYT